MRCLERGVVVWLTGLPASGKTTLALLAAERVRGLGLELRFSMEIGCALPSTLMSAFLGRIGGGIF